MHPSAVASLVYGDLHATGPGSIPDRKYVTGPVGIPGTDLPSLKEKKLKTRSTVLRKHMPILNDHYSVLPAEPEFRTEVEAWATEPAALMPCRVRCGHRRAVALVSAGQQAEIRWEFVDSLRHTKSTTE